MLKTENRIEKIGNSAFLPLSQDILRELGANVGDEVRIETSKGHLVLHVVDGEYGATHQAADRMAERYGRTLELLGNEQR